MDTLESEMIAKRKGNVFHQEGLRMLHKVFVTVVTVRAGKSLNTLKFLLSPLILPLQNLLNATLKKGDNRQYKTRDTDPSPSTGF